jgi:Secretion system C-terminal sorting domain
MVQNTAMREPSTMELSFNTFEKTWDMRTDSKLTYNTASKFKFMSGVNIIVQPEIDNNNVLILYGTNNTLMSFAIIPNSHVDIDPCTFVTISPNPVYDETNVVIESERTRSAKVIVYDNFGNIKQVISSLSLVAGKNNQTISLRNEKPGLYRVVVEAEGKRQIVPIQKW